LTPHIQVVNAGLDWLTTTATDKKTAWLLLHEAQKIASEESRRGFFTKPWRQSGYAGFACGRIQHGERPDSAIARVSSSLADEEWWRLYQISDHVTRLDVQMTIRPSCGPNPFIHKIHRQLKRHFATWKKHPQITVWSNSDGGLTLYLGKRQSAVMLRCYNKEAESGDLEFAGCVRLELELKDCAVKPAFAFLFSHLPIRNAANELVSAFMKERGCLSFRSIANPPSLYEGQSPVTDELRALEWLKTQVKPSVLNLISRGQLGSVLSNLGLSEFVIARPNGSENSGP